MSPNDESFAARWKSDSIFPENRLGDQMVLVQGRRALSDTDRIMKVAKGWTPFSTWLVGDGRKHLLPAVCMPVVSRVARGNYLRKYGISVLLWLMAACFVSVVSLIGGKDKGVAGIAMLVALYFVLDFVILRKPQALEERARFIHWVRSDMEMRYTFLVAAAVAFGLGVMQWILVRGCESAICSVEKYGLVFKRALDGEWWRFVTGPYLHANYSHYLGNVSVFVPLFAFSYVACKRKAVYVFILANLLIPLLSTPWTAERFDAYAGISAGIFSLFGLIFLHVAINRKEFPYGFALNILILSLTTLFASSILNKNALFVSHVIGLLLGCGFSFAMNFHVIASRILRGVR